MLSLLAILISNLSINLFVIFFSSFISQLVYFFYKLRVQINILLLLLFVVVIYRDLNGTRFKKAEWAVNHYSANISHQTDFQFK